MPLEKFGGIFFDISYQQLTLHLYPMRTGLAGLVELADKCGLYVTTGDRVGFSPKGPDKLRPEIKLNIWFYHLRSTRGKYPTVAIKSFKTITNQLISQLSHELGHFLIAPKGRRYKKNYGIRTNYSSRSIRAKYHWNLDEYKAQLVENHLYKRYRLPWIKKPLAPFYKLKNNIKAIQDAELWFENDGQKLIKKLDRLIKSKKGKLTF